MKLDLNLCTDFSYPQNLCLSIEKFRVDKSKTLLRDNVRGVPGVVIMEEVYNSIIFTLLLCYMSHVTDRILFIS